MGVCWMDECNVAHPIPEQTTSIASQTSAGQTTSIGVSNFCKQCLECIASDPAGASLPVVNQIELHVGMG